MAAAVYTFTEPTAKRACPMPEWEAIEAVKALVKEHCPKLEGRVAEWLACYKDPALLYASLLREYGAAETSDRFACAADDSDDDEEDKDLRAAIALSLASPSGGTGGGGGAYGLSRGGASSSGFAGFGGYAASPPSAAGASSSGGRGNYPAQPPPGNTAAFPPRTPPAQLPAPVLEAGFAPLCGAPRPSPAVQQAPWAADAPPPDEGRRGSQRSSAGRPRDKLYKVRFCEHLRAGKCRKRSEDCTFAHSDEELSYWLQARADDSMSLRQGHALAAPDAPPPPPAPLLAPPPVPIAVPPVLHAAAPTPPSRRAPTPGSSFMELMPVDISFCHDTVSPFFRSGETILGTLLQLAKGEVLLRDIPMMQVVLHEDRLYSISNRRLCLYRLCQHLGLITKEAPVKVELMESLPANFSKKFTTQCQGDWVRVRKDGRICGRTLEETTFGKEELLAE